MVALIRSRLVLARPCATRQVRQCIVRRSIASTSPRTAHKDAQDKDSMNTEPNEYSKSGSDSQAAHTDAAFNPNKTRPEGEEASSEAQSGKHSPLNESPANQEFSKPQSATSPKTEGSATEDGGNSSRERSSGGGSPNKQGSKDRSGI